MNGISFQDLRAFRRTLDEGPPYRSVISTPERKLWASVITQAFEDLVLEPRDPLVYRDKVFFEADQKTRVEVEMWFASDEDAPGSLRWICDLLDIDIDFIREEAARRVRPRPHWWRAVTEHLLRERLRHGTYYD